MFKFIPLVAVIVAAAILPARAQDIVGLEACMREKQIDRRTGCLQANVEYLQGLVTKQAADARTQIGAATAEIAQLKATTTALRADIVRLEDLVKTAVKPPEKK